MPIEIPRLPVNKRDFVQIDEGNASYRDRLPDPELVQAIVRAHAWLKLLCAGKFHSIDALVDGSKATPQGYPKSNPPRVPGTDHYQRDLIG